MPTQNSDYSLARRGLTSFRSFPFPPSPPPLRRYVSSETGLEDTLAHARKDGYLDRRDFLDRVDASKEEQWDQARRGGRRR